MGSRRRDALLAIVSFATLCLCTFLANNFYWGATAADMERGEFYLVHRPLPQLPGQILWATLKPLLLLSLLATLYFLYRCFRALTRPRIGFCPRCGYDLRATPNLCPECGMAIPSSNLQQPATQNIDDNPDF